MSWDSYIDNLIDQTKDEDGVTHCDKACIIRLDGGELWTSAGHEKALKLQGSEGATIARIFKSKDFSPFKQRGIHVEEIRYEYKGEGDDKIVYGEKRDHGAVTLRATKTAVVIGHCPEGGKQGNLNKGIGSVAGYIESIGM